MSKGHPVCCGRKTAVDMEQENVFECLICGCRFVSGEPSPWRPMDEAKLKELEVAIARIEKSLADIVNELKKGD